MSIIKELKNKFKQEVQTDTKDIPVILSDKVEEFIKWYTDTMVKGEHTDKGEYNEPKWMRNFIEKVAVWYELRYPDYEINRIMPGSSQENKSVTDVMFHSNPYINGVFGEDSDINYLDWSDFYNTKAFINSLSSDEKWYFVTPKYPSLVYFDEHKFSAHFHLTSKGIINIAEHIEVLQCKCSKEATITNEEFKGKHIKEAVEIMKDKGIAFPDYSEIEVVITAYDNRVYMKEEILNCIMYRIIERGGNRIGPRRALMFAKEFNRSVDIPMMYGVDTSDPGLRGLVNEYIKAGGSKELICYMNYFDIIDKHKKIDTISVEDLIRSCSDNSISFYTTEENQLHQRLVNSLASNLDYQLINKEKTKNYRLERKIKKASKN